MTLPTVPVGRTVEVRVPATSANLGPGFDTLGLALGHYDHLEVTATAEPGVRVEIEGVGAGGAVATDESNLVVRALDRGLADAGVARSGLILRARNVIPHGGGMGSSAAAIVAGLMAARGLVEGVSELSASRILELATEIEGHPDNVAPALYGGLTIAWTTPHGPEAKKLPVHRGVAPLLLIPSHAVSTELARSLQPESVPVVDAVFNVSRSSLLVAALLSSPELLFHATEDRLHQDYRAEAMPATAHLIAQLRQAGYAAVVSGAGPSILVLCESPAARAAAEALVPEVSAEPWRALALAVDLRGATVSIRQGDTPSARPNPVA